MLPTFILCNRFSNLFIVITSFQLAFLQQTTLMHVTCRYKFMKFDVRKSNNKYFPILILCHCFHIQKIFSNKATIHAVNVLTGQKYKLDWVLGCGEKRREKALEVGKRTAPIGQISKRDTRSAHEARLFSILLDFSFAIVYRSALSLFLWAEFMFSLRLIQFQ